MANTRTRKSGKLFTGIIAFLLGFIFAIVVEVAVIAGGAYFVLSTPLDNLLGLLPDGNDDGKGNQIIDTTGDIKTALDLIEEISEIAGKGENMALGDIIKLSPALDNYLEELYGELGKNYGIYLDGEEIKAQTVSSIGTYVTETVVPNINVYQVASATGMADGLLENPIVKVVLIGSEAKYVVNGDDSYIVYYDEYVYDGAQGVYVRYEQPAEVEAAAARPDEKYPQGVNAQKWLTETNRTTEEGEAIYRQYFYSDAEGRYTVTAKGDDGEYIYTEWSAQVDYPASYGSAPLGYTGCYYVDEKGDNVYFPGMEVLLGNFLDNDFSYLNDMSVADLFNEMGSGEGEEGEKDIIGEVFGDVSVGDLIEGNVDFNGVINDIELTALIEADPENLVMPYIAYGITDLVKVEGQAYAYTASYNFGSGTYSYQVTAEGYYLTKTSPVVGPLNFDDSLAPNSPPVPVEDRVSKTVYIIPFQDASVSVDLSTLATDPDGDAITYEIVSSSFLENTDYTVDGNTLTQTGFSLSRGSYTVRATDARGLSCDIEVEIITMDQEVADSTINSSSANAEFETVTRPLKNQSDDEQYWSGPFVMPVAMDPVRTSSSFGYTRLINGVADRHNGVDFPVAKGTPVTAPNNGRVLYAGYLQLTGNTVCIEHGFGLKSWYYHMDSLSCSTGDFLETGDPIGAVGSTGYSTGPHLHFALSVNNVYIDPFQLMNQDLS